jgi:hypothetical protein
VHTVLNTVLHTVLHAILQVAGVQFVLLCAVLLCAVLLCTMFQYRHRRRAAHQSHVKPSAQSIPPVLTLEMHSRRQAHMMRPVQVPAKVRHEIMVLTTPALEEFDFTAEGKFDEVDDIA